MNCVLPATNKLIMNLPRPLSHEKKISFEAASVINLYLAFIILSPLATIGFWMVDRNFMHLPKILSYPAILLMAVLLLRVRFILKDWFVIYMLFYSFFVVINGLLEYTVSKAFYAHALSLLLPIIGISFGYYAAKNYNLQEKFESKIVVSGVILSAVIALYYIFNQSGSIPYFGVSTLIFIPALYAFSKNRFDVFLFFLFASFFTGKRTVILGLFFVIALYYIINSRKNIGTLILITLIFSFIFFVFGQSIVELSIFRRIAILFDADNSETFNTVTSGRVNDVFAAIKSINENSIYWLIGKGAGATFDVDYGFGDDKWTTHYSHITPFSYIFLGGILLMVPVYFKLFSLFIFSLNPHKDFFGLLFIFYVTTSMTGASLFSDPFVWLVAGVVIYNKKVAAN